MPPSPPAGLVWTPVLLWHAGVVAGLVLLDVLLGSGLVSLLVVLAGIPWSALALPSYGTRFDVLVDASALANVAAHAWWLRHEELQGD